MNISFKINFNKCRDAIYSENINFFNTISSVFSISYILLLPNIISFIMALIFVLLNFKILINISIKSKLHFFNKCSLILFLILDSIFIQLPGIILATSLSCFQTNDLCHLNDNIYCQDCMAKIKLITAKIKLSIDHIFTEYHASKIFFKW